ncbi:cardiolipin synthetase [Halobacillus fulvus]|nr:cardiolipin synthetase [Halobacillus fulvus]
MITLLFIVMIFILLLVIDFKLGRKHHHQNPRKLPFRRTTGDYHLFKNGSPLYERLFQDIASATKQVDIFFYLIDNDYISENFLQILKNKASEGVPVRLLTDRLGGYRVNKQMRQSLKEAGVDFHFAEVPGFPYLFYRLNRRNHRKIAVIDGEIAYAGGFNIGKNYIGETPKFGDWRDYHMRLTGPVVQELHGVFLDDWYLATGEKHEAIHVDKEGAHPLSITATDGFGLEEEINEIIKDCQQELLIGSPYFIPSPTLQNSLLKALKRGVQLYILVPLKADHPFVKEGGLPYLKELSEHGAHVKFFDAGFYHAKVIMSDQKLADLGTANFDRRSLFLNKEVNTFIYDDTFVRNLRNMYMEDFEDAISLDESFWKNRSLKTKFNQKLAILLRPFL